MEQRTFSNQVADLICELHKMHRDNKQRTYYAKDQSSPKERFIPIMPVTPFVFEFFIYNSIYQVDWCASLQTECVENHPSRSYEATQQDKLEKFLKPYIRKEPRLLHEAFSPICSTNLAGDWLEVVPDSGISAVKGRRFFRQLRELQNRLRTTDKPEEFQVDNSLFDLIRNCRGFIYRVRNNIFHGSKVLGETYEEKQKKRIQIYLTFLRCMTSLFFLVCDRHLLRTASNFSTEA